LRRFLAAAAALEALMAIARRSSAVRFLARVQLVSRRERGGVTTSYYRVHKQNETAIVTYAVGKDGKVAVLEVSPDREYR